ncbi:hypothetical protein UPYG_G00020860 [Umbra pygmaea]|uniref:Uncharacterized protein n=1 Tax=Umbra pygmaea TaxID=75934 RepID=A0ABD0XKQ9_UMBPY
MPMTTSIPSNSRCAGDFPGTMTTSTWAFLIGSSCIILRNMSQLQAVSCVLYSIATPPPLSKTNLIVKETKKDVREHKNRTV